jgi:hypothetical protein
VSDKNTEVAPAEWRTFFERLSDDLSGDDVTIEVLTDEYGHQYEAEELPFDFLDYDDKDDAFIVAVGGRDRRYPALRHIINQPKRIVVDTLSPNQPWAIDVEAVDGSRTIITFQRPPALPPPSD